MDQSGGDNVLDKLSYGGISCLHSLADQCVRKPQGLQRPHPMRDGGLDSLFVLAISLASKSLKWTL